MSKRTFILLGFIVLIVLGAWVFSDSVINFLVKLKDLNEDQRESLKYWIDVSAAVVTIVAVLGGGLATLFKFLKKDNNTVSDSSNRPAEPEQTIEALKTDYYRNLAEQCQRYDLGNVRESRSVAEATAVRVELADVYVDLMAHEIKPKDKAKVAKQSEMETSRLMLEFLEEHDFNRLVIRGDVGSGKTSIINFLSYSIIESFSNKTLSPKIPDRWLRRPVVRLLLRKIGGQICESKDQEEQLFRLMRERVHQHIKTDVDINSTVFEQFWNQFLADFKTQGVLILDGLDEVSGTHEVPEGWTRRQILLKAISQLAQNPAHQGMVIVITSRNKAYGGDDALPGFRLLQLDPLNNSDRYEVFIRHWYQKVSEAEADKSNHEADALALINTIAKRRSLQALTKTPLLTTLILVLDKAGQKLGESRAEIYKSAVTLLLDRWPRQLLEHSDSVSAEECQALEVLKINASILLESMKRLAIDTYQAEGTRKDEEGNIVFSVEAVESALKKPLQNAGLGFDHQDSCKTFLGQRSQILVAIGDGLSFVHKSFHEYLAAAGIMDEDLSCEDKLWEMSSSGDKRDWWREVFLFALNIGKAEFVMKLIQLNILSQQVTAINQTDLGNHLNIMSFFSVAVLENDLENVVSRGGSRNRKLTEAYDRLQQHIRLLWEDERLSIVQRAQLGRIAGRCGDIRKGLTVKREGYEFQYHLTATHSFRIPDLDWQEIKPGGFQMGTAEGQEQGYANEKPAHKVAFEQSFHLTRSTITNVQYQAFIEAGGYDDDSIWGKLPTAAQEWRQGGVPGLSLLETFPKASREDYQQFLLSDKIRHQPRLWLDHRWNIANHPVVGVSWFEALAYCEWLNQNQALILPPELADKNLTIRLPTEDEWEYAARGDDAMKYACGDDLSPELANYDETEMSRATTSGVFPPSQAFDLQDMTGNVWEWTASRWGEDFMICAFQYGDDYQANKLKQNDPEKLEYRIIRGGSWINTSDLARCAFRYRLHPNNRYNDSGFRVVCSG